MPDIDISVLGDKELERRFKRYPIQTQKKVLRPALRKGAKRSKNRIVDNIKADDLIYSGNMLTAFSKTKIRSQSSSRNLIRIGPVLPTRDEFKISATDKFFYPAVLEKRFHFMRNAIDKFKNQEYRELARDIGAGLKGLLKQ